MQRWVNQIVMPKRATKQETELRVAHAAELVAEGQAYSSITVSYTHLTLPTILLV